MVDNETQWIKVKKGLNIDQTARELSFCTETIKRNNLLLIPDTLNNPRFNTHPSVTGGLKVRFYAAAPLTTHEGHRIGTLSVIGYKPHKLNNKQKFLFKILAKHSISVKELKLSFEQLDKSFTELKQERQNRLANEIRLTSLFESLTDSYFLLGKDGEILDFNRSAYDNIKKIFEKKLVRGLPMTNFLTVEYQLRFPLYYQLALQGAKIQVETLADYGEQGKIWWDSLFEPVRNENGEILGVS